VVAASTHQHTAERWMVSYRLPYLRFIHNWVIRNRTGDCVLVYFKVSYMMQYCMLLYKIKEDPGHVPLPNAQYIPDWGKVFHFIFIFKY
jgi:hypothetical protein